MCDSDYLENECTYYLKKIMLIIAFYVLNASFFKLNFYLYYVYIYI